jgi:hypothetical protein
LNANPSKTLEWQDVILAGSGRLIAIGFDRDISHKLLEKNDDFMKRVILSGTPIIKFTASGGKLKNLTEKKLLDNKETVIYKLLNFK